MSIRRVVAMETVTLTDLTDAIISGTEPDVKTEGMLWIDGDNILKQWNGVSWDKVELDVSSLDPDLSETITTILGKVGSIADDGVLDFEDRKVINEEVALIIGDYPSTTLTSYTALPDYNDFDSNPRGSFGRVRETTRSVVGGQKAISLPEYVALASAFQKLGDLLIKTRPVRMWDITTLNKDVVITLSDHGITPDDLRTGLLNYYMAELTLSEYNNKTAVEVSKDYTDENIKDTVKEMVHMYAYSDSMTEPPQEGVPWRYEPLSPVEDRYIWMRTRVIYKNGDESSSEPYLSSFDITSTLGDLDQKTNNPAFSTKGLEGGGVEVELGSGKNLLPTSYGEYQTIQVEAWGTSFVHPLSNRFYLDDLGLKVGDTVTISSEIKGTIPTRYRIDDQSGYHVYTNTSDYVTNGRLVATFKIADRTTEWFSVNYDNQHQYNDNDGGVPYNIEVKNQMIEKGSIATTYEPPTPEDGTQELDIVSSVGGRNYALNTDWVTEQPTYINVDIPDYLKGERVTFSFYLELENGTRGSQNRIGIEGSNMSTLDKLTYYGSWYDLSNGGSYKGVFSQDVTIDKYFSGNTLRLLTYPHLINADIKKLGFVKVEKGTVATDWTPAPEDIPYDTLIDGIYKTKAEFPSDEAYSLPSFPNSNYVYTVGDFEPQLNTRWKSPVWKSVNTMQDDMVIMGNNIDTTMEGTRQIIYQLRDGVYDDGSEYSLTKFHNIVDTVEEHNQIIGGEDGSLAEIVMRDDYFSQRIGTPINRLTYPNNAINIGLGTSSNSHTVTVSPGLDIDKGLTLQFKTSHYASSNPIEYLIKLTTENEDTSSWITSVSKSEHNIQRLTPSVTGVPKTLEITLVGDNSTKFTLWDVQLTEEQPDDLFPLPFHDNWSDGNFSRILQLENSIRDEVVFGGRVVSAIETNLEGVHIQGKKITFDGDLVEMTNLNVRNLKGDTAEFLRITLDEGIGDSETDGSKTRVIPTGLQVVRYRDDGIPGNRLGYGPYGVVFREYEGGVLGGKFGALFTVGNLDSDNPTTMMSINSYGKRNILIGYHEDPDASEIQSRITIDGHNRKVDSWVDVDMHGYWIKTGRVRITNWGLDLLDANDNELVQIALTAGSSNIDDLLIGRPQGGDIYLATKGGTSGSYTTFIKVNSSSNRVDFFRDINMNSKRILNESDERLKENITPTRQNSLELTQRFNFYDYDFIDGGKDRLGIIAQELQKIAPEIVEEGEDGYLSYDSNRLFMTFGHATQQFYKEYEQEIKKLKEEIRQLKEKL